MYQVRNIVFPAFIKLDLKPPAPANGEEHKGGGGGGGGWWNDHADSSRLGFSPEFFVNFNFRH
jgi:hypothetical protein